MYWLSIRPCSILILLFFASLFIPLSAQTTTVTISAEQLPASTVTNATKVTVKNPNRFRYNIAIQIQQTVSNAPTPITGLQPPAAAAKPAAAPAVVKTLASAKKEDAQQLVTMAGGICSFPVAAGAASADQNIASAQTTSCTEKAQLAALTSGLPGFLVTATAEQQCFKNLQQTFGAILLSQDDQTALVKRLDVIKGQNSCRLGFTPSDVLNEIVLSLKDSTALQQKLITFQLSTEGVAWVAKPANTATFSLLLKENSDTITGLQTLLTDKNVSATDTIEQYNAVWLSRSIASDDSASWKLSESLTCTIQWFGRLSGQSISLNSFDMASDTPTVKNSPYFTNACLPSLTVTTGLGLSFKANPTYAFESVTNYSATPPVSVQVIGTSTDYRITPLYVGQMNYSYLGSREGSIGAHISGGLGIGSSAAGTTTDIFLGHAVSFAHRAVFITPALHVTQRQALQGGYALGNLKADLTTIPTTTKWKLGFALTFTLPVVSAP